MIVVKNRKKISALDVFSSLEEFYTFLGENYNKLNYDSEEIKRKVEKVYSTLVTESGEVKFLRLNRWLPTQFGFKYKNVKQREFWSERGWFSEEIDKIILENAKKVSDNYSRQSGPPRYAFLLPENSSDVVVKYKSASWNTNTHPTCNCCGQKVSIRRVNESNKKNEFYYKLSGCSNDSCESVSMKKNDLYRCFLPEDICEVHIKKISDSLKSGNRLSTDSWVNKGFSEEEAKNKISEIQSGYSKKVKNRFIASKDNLRKKGYSEEEIVGICQTPANINFWINKGFTEKGAEEKVRGNQSYASGFVDYDLRLLPSNEEYWIDKGFSEKESKIKVSESQRTFSLDICIEKHGEKEGRKAFADRQVKWQKSLLENGNLKCGYSKVSQDLFWEIVPFYETVLRKKISFATKNKEYFLSFKGGEFYQYDFVDRNSDKIIEYNGDKFHANPEIFSENDFPNPFVKDLTAKEIWEKDN